MLNEFLHLCYFYGLFDPRDNTMSQDLGVISVFLLLFLFYFSIKVFFVFIVRDLCMHHLNVLIRSYFVLSWK